MPLWKRSSGDDQQKEAQAQAQAQAQQDAEASLRSLAAGGLPVQAQRRLKEETAAGHPLFTSDLSANELLLTRQPGCTTLGQVMGSTVYHVGRQYITVPYYTYSQGYRAHYEFELDVLSRAHQHAAALALGRLEQEAALLHAHGVIGVRFTRRHYAWEREILEYMAIGTAIRLVNAPPPQRPFLSDLSGQEFWTLMQAGYYPAGLVTGFCAYEVVSRLRSTFANYYNQEIPEFRQAIYTARKLGMSRLLDAARGLNALGVVGMQIEIERELEDEVEEQQEITKLFVHFSATGTAITSRPGTHKIPTPVATLSFTDLRPGRFGETRELTSNL